MKAKDIFGIIVRVFALWIITWGAWQLTAVLAMIAVPASPLTAASYLSYGLPAIFVGIAILRFADDVVHFTYHRPTEPKSTTAVPFPPIPPDDP